MAALKIFIFFFLISFFASGETIHLAATEWCPYTCSKMGNKGIVTEFISKLLKERGDILKVSFLPWNRAVSNAKERRVDGLLTGVHSEAPFLIFTNTPTTYYQSCLFGLKDRRESLTIKKMLNYTVGVISKYSYGKEIDSILAREKSNSNLTVIHGKEPLKRLGNLVKLGRLDFFIEERNVSSFNFNGFFKSFSCGEKNPFYLGMDPKNKKSKETLEYLNKAIKSNQKLLKEIIKESL